MFDIIDKNEAFEEEKAKFFFKQVLKVNNKTIYASS